MKELYDICKSRTKIWKEFPEGSHNDTVAEDNYFDSIDEFIVEQVLGSKHEDQSQNP
jgi:hypothetical protein